MKIYMRSENVYVSSNNAGRQFGASSGKRIIGITLSYPNEGNKAYIVSCGPVLPPQSGGFANDWEVRWVFEGDANIGIDPGTFWISEVDEADYEEVS